MCLLKLGKHMKLLHLLRLHIQSNLHSAHGPEEASACCGTPSFPEAQLSMLSRSIRSLLGDDVSSGVPPQMLTVAAPTME